MTGAGYLGQYFVSPGWHAMLEHVPVHGSMSMLYVPPYLKTTSGLPFTCSGGPEPFVSVREVGLELSVLLAMPLWHWSQVTQVDPPAMGHHGINPAA